MDSGERVQKAAKKQSFYALKTGTNCVVTDRKLGVFEWCLID